MYGRRWNAANLVLGALLAHPDMQVHGAESDMAQVLLCVGPS